MYTYHTYHVYKLISSIHRKYHICDMLLICLKTPHRIHISYIHDIWITGLYHVYHVYIYMYTYHVYRLYHIHTPPIYTDITVQSVYVDMFWNWLRSHVSYIFPDPHKNPAMKHQMISRKAAPLIVGSPKDTVLSSDPGIPNPWVVGVVTLGFHRNSVKPRPL